MEFIRGSNIRFRHEGQVETLLEKLSFSFNHKSKIGLVGNNGCGKTTLLALIRGEVRPLDGELFVAKETIFGYLPQEVRLDDETTVLDYLWQARPDLSQLKKNVSLTPESSPDYAALIAEYYELGAGHFEAHMDRLLAGFHLDGGKQVLPVGNLSGGEKTKVALARILLTKPNLMLLDEPTNHLELKSLVWLEDYLQTCAIPYLVVSHDRRFLDNCVTEIWELNDRGLRVYSGNYTFYKKDKDLEFRRQQAEYENQQKKIKQLEQAAGQRRGQADRIENFKFKRSVSKKGAVQKRDDGSGRSGQSSNKTMRTAKAIAARIGQMLAREEAKKPFLEKERRISLGESDLKNPVVLKVDNLSKGYGSFRVFDNLNLALHNGVKLGVIGGNGSGKTTLLDILTGHTTDYSGAVHWAPKARMGYYSQEHEHLNSSHTILDEVLQGRLQEQTLARTILGRLNVKRDKVYQTIDTLSLGERSKVALAKILFSEANVLIFDEPTNHLELSSIEAFEEALLEYAGTVILVSHDRYLLDKIATEILDMETGQHYEGGFTAYLERSGDQPEADQH